MTACDTSSIVEWLTDGARTAPRPEMIIAELCERVVQCGIPLWRAALFVRTLHPEVMGRRFIWQPGAGVTITEGAVRAAGIRRSSRTARSSPSSIQARPSDCR